MKAKREISDLSAATVKEAPFTSDSAFGPSVSITVDHDDASSAAMLSKLEKTEHENQQLLREVLLSRKNLDIAQSNIASLKALSNQLASQLNAANAEIDLLRQRRDAAEMRSAREHEQAMADLRSSYENRLAGVRREMEEQLEINTQLSNESQDAHRKADKSFRDIIATKDELIAELTRTVECMQSGMKMSIAKSNDNNNNSGINASRGGSVSNNNNNNNMSLSSPSRFQQQQQQKAIGGAASAYPRKTTYDAASLRCQVIEPTMDLVRLSLKVLKSDTATRETPLGTVNAAFHTSEKRPVTRYFVDIQADKHRLDEVPTVDLRVASGGSRKHFTQPDWPRVWKFQTPQGELITLSMDVSSLL